MTADPDINYWSASEARLILAPHLTSRQVRDIIRLSGIAPAGERHSASKRGRMARVFPATALITLFGTLSEAGMMVPPDGPEAA